ncbi:hypothetical protein KOY49_04310 [Candidatus Minimicrobia vallesae]|uniref:Uncharacterized protein n=1 Tax=Candidatus Minimicrobia vallesae TaxID=2841264 RepID=A0A8F1M9J9_9BACT|nr:hypothetical protein [Candidatus Minimicrobia vallesae]QWQ31357.1 hypothetical protein KOY49_04310 [Candidatus Minimicrobia vallesae]
MLSDKSIGFVWSLVFIFWLLGLVSAACASRTASVRQLFVAIDVAFEFFIDDCFAC